MAIIVIFSNSCASFTQVQTLLGMIGKDGSNQWNVSFSREAHDWEVDVFASFIQ